MEVLVHSSHHHLPGATCLEIVFGSLQLKCCPGLQLLCLPQSEVQPDFSGRSCPPNEGHICTSTLSHYHMWDARTASSWTAKSSKDHVQLLVILRGMLLSFQNQTGSTYLNVLLYCLPSRKIYQHQRTKYVRCSKKRYRIYKSIEEAHPEQSLRS